MNRTLLLLLVASLPLAAFTRPIDPAPGEDSVVAHGRISSVTVHSGAIANTTSDAAMGDFLLLAPSSLLLQNDLSGYSRNAGDDYGSGNVFSASVDIVFPNAEHSHYRPNPLLRLGITYDESTALADYYNRDIRIPADTFVSTATGQILYGDSVLHSYYDMEYRSGKLLLDVSLLFRTNPEARWSIYAGLGLQAGMTLNARTEIRYNHSDGLELTSADGRTHYGYAGYEEDEYTSELFHNASGFAGGGYIPLGVDFRMGNNSEFWKRLHLFVEMRPGLSVVSVPELRTQVQTVFVSTFGLRVGVD